LLIVSKLVGADLVSARKTGVTRFHKACPRENGEQAHLSTNFKNNKNLMIGWRV